LFLHKKAAASICTNTETQGYDQTLVPACWQVCLTQDWGGWTDFYYILFDHSLQEDRSIDATFDACVFC
jgi:hypothetical protein